MIRQNIFLITLLVTAALMSLVGIQLFWVKNAVRLKEEEFSRRVHTSLDELVFRLEKKIAAAKISKKIKYHKRSVSSQLSQSDKKGDSLFHGKGQEQVMVKILEELSIDSNGVVTTSIKEHHYEGDSAKNITDFPAQYSETTSDLKKLKIELIEKRAEMFNDIFDELVSVNIYKKFKTGMDTLLFDSLLRSELVENGIKASYVYQVSEHSKADPASFSALHPESDPTGQYYHVNLSPSNFFSNPLFLTLYFPDERSYLLQTMWMTLSLSAVIILVLISAFYYTINTIRRQKKLTQIKNDFIGNMTHEFKTPISTIALAGEMLGDPSIAKTPEKVQRFVGMIREENKRLGVLVESILQTAVLDKGDLKLKLSEFDLHEVITSAIDKVKLQIDLKKGTLKTALQAGKANLMADKVHITNIVHNLLDNALKYSKENPEITIGTDNAPDGVLLTVQDRGIGISTENQKRIFEQFYRVPTGNLHNVKGFGLGLSYVRTIVVKHGGEISVESEINQGSTFKVYLPFANH